MPNDNENARVRRNNLMHRLFSIRPYGSGKILAFAAVIVFFQSACLFWGKKEAVMPTAPVRIAFLPFNTPEGSQKLQWASMAVPIMMAKISEKAEGFDPVPLWETMRFAIESTGDSRTMDQESAVYVANWLNAKWSVMGSLTQETKDRLTLLMDFIPSRDGEIPFRYVKTIQVDSVDLNIRKAFGQFLNYVSARPMDPKGELKTTLASLRQLAEVLNREYGWTVPAEPGNAQEIVSNLVQSDPRLARFLFRPALYPGLEDK